ncbi:MAG: O-antigen ligase family protein [Erythrobacter sp.]|nr:O-antigen ligase family protein [Erythrobacter sp.]
MAGRRTSTGWGASIAAIGRAELALLASLVLAVMLFGGSSRYDVMQNALMQPIAWLVAGCALLVMTRETLRPLRVPLAMLLALVAIMALQLVPLGHGLWTSLPGRAPLAAIAAALGDDAARPASMVPWRTANAFASLGIPLAALLVMAALGRKAVMPVLVCLVLLATANSLLAIMQIASGYAEATYPYAVTNDGAPVGIFANRNHSAVFGALAMLVIGFLATRDPRERPAGADILLWSAFGAIFLTILVNGSRAGMLTAGIALVTTAWLVHRRIASQPARPGMTGRQQQLARYLPTAVILVSAVGLVTLFVFADRLTAYQRMVESNPLEDLRFKILPVLGDMITGYFPVGIGFGGFEDVYRIHETGDLLGPRYLNMAHNDWLQWLIEGGLPGALLLLVLLGWLAFHCWRLRKVSYSWFVLGAAGIAIIALASYFDYPLRTPLFQVAATWFVCVLALVERRPTREGDDIA